MRGILFDGEAALVAEGLGVTDLEPAQVRVRIGAAGVCHSDVSVINGTFGAMFPPPFVMGHEGAGQVLSVGADVTTVAPGDHVVIATIDNCGRCPVCATGHPTLCQTSKLGAAIARRNETGEEPGPGDLPAYFTYRGERILGFANTGVFAEEVVVSQGQVVAIDKRVPFTSACLIGCGVLTGTGAIFNRAKVYRGESVAVVGVGGIGLNVIQAARIAGATKIIAVDNNPAKENFARQFGATHFVDSGKYPAVASVQEISPGGVDCSVECVGHTALMREAVEMLRPGGNMVILGVAGMEAEMAIAPFQLYQDKSIMGCRYGSSRPAFDIPALVDLYLDGRLLLDELVSATYDLAELDRAFEDLEAGKLARGVLTMG
ncbi:zinc-binding dehydrogenase [Candidatus Poriferisocius sp.]|uniref:zinc-binding dehydrogenase n=1 Tax=Candidatus Poriferisocius sp. TaxID=3101276 RepID=UPI003B01E7BC